MDCASIVSDLLLNLGKKLDDGLASPMRRRHLVIYRVCYKIRVLILFAKIRYHENPFGELDKCSETPSWILRDRGVCILSDIMLNHVKKACVFFLFYMCLPTPCIVWSQHFTLREIRIPCYSPLLAEVYQDKEGIQPCYWDLKKAAWDANTGYITEVCMCWFSHNSGAENWIFLENEVYTIRWLVPCVACQAIRGHGFDFAGWKNSVREVPFYYYGLT